MYYTQLRAFHAVAVHGGFSKAAKELRLTQPSISEHVRTLEIDFGVLLFNRLKRSVEPTELGKQLMGVTRRLIEAEEEAIQLLSETQILERGFLALGADGPIHAIPLIARYRQQYPGVKVTLNTGNTSEVRDQLLNFKTDILVAGEIPEDSRFTKILLRRDPMIAYVAAGHPWAKRKSISFDAFGDTTVVIRERGSTTRRLLEEELDRCGLRPKELFEVDGQEAARAAVAAGIGAGIISRAELGDDPRLAPVRIKNCKLEMEEIVACMREREHLKTINAFMAMAKQMAKSAGVLSRKKPC